MDHLSLSFIVIAFDIFLVFIGIIFWYLMWVREYGCSIPNKKMEGIQTYFHSKNFNIVFSELYDHIFDFDKEYVISTCGFESYAYMLF